jgi:6-phosphogluconolactonase/glucosamine-6-phosphate isomerase/deaminase
MSEPLDPTPYELEHEITKPDLPGEVIVRESGHDVCAALAADLLLHAHNCVRAFGDFHLCLSGDASIEPVLLHLLTDPAIRDLPWRRTHVWLLSERAGALASADYDLLHETVVIHADLPKEQAHAIDTSREDAAAHYDRQLRETLAWREKGHDRLDYALLSPSAVPGDWMEFDDGDEIVRAYADRIACTRRLINASRFISVFAVGEQARPVIQETTACSHAMSALDPVGGVLRWYLDEAACPQA